MTDLSGQIALVTGASRGIGAASAKALAAAGAHVVITGRDAKSLESIEEAIFEAGGSATIAPCDLAEGDSIARLAEAITQRWAKLDVMVHAAAVLPQLTAVRDIDQAQFSKALTVNVLATQALIAWFDRLFKASADPRLVYLTSSVASEARPFWGAYGASKAAAENLIASYAEEARNTSKTRVAILDPGATRTAMRAKAYPGEDPASVKPPEAVAERLLALLGERFASPHRERVNLSS
ncbi:MAG: SDR family NAD(P)-dependent oxidoreductase [Novosphingobium sp.]|uniref:SDR family NAD(P)-dependent oxidoreductase n=1 Tax=Novosphingobium sp. TaxID=1874826 RepID=UPI0032BE9CA2